jgi:class 3 adenylate cyclase
VSEGDDRGPDEAPEDGITERVAAILAADAVGYSRLMADDEQATVRLLDRARKVFRNHVEADRGRVVDATGAVFETTNGAVRAALAIQEGLGAKRRVQ